MHLPRGTQGPSAVPREIRRPPSTIFVPTLSQIEIIFLSIDILLDNFRGNVILEKKFIYVSRAWIFRMENYFFLIFFLK